MARFVPLAVLLLLAAGCGHGGIFVGGDGGAKDAAGTDGGVRDAGRDGGARDAGTNDAGGDAGSDAGTTDGGCPDSDHDGVCDSVDKCPGYPDSQDANHNGIPDGCDTNPWGAPQSGYPTWRERAILVLTNAVRMAPTAWRDTYMGDFTPSAAGILSPSSYPVQPPLFWNFNLNRVARAHSVDMANNCGLGSSAVWCDGTAWDTKIKQYYTTSADIDENLAAGTGTPRYTVNLWLCDASGGSCCADGAGCDGHRANIMRSTMQELGAGWASGTQSPGTFWTEDLGGGTPAVTAPIVAGAHVFLPDATKIGFFLNYYDPTHGAPQSVTLWIAGASHPMTDVLGAPAAGTYTVALPKAAGCRTYHFLAIDALGMPWRYPAAGELVTATEGTCSATKNWQP